MSSDHWRRVSQVYHDARDRDSNDRMAFLDRACAGDDALRKEVESLLAHEEDADEFLAAPALDMAANVLTRESGPSLVGEQFGSYKILSLLGAGGMGEVYRAHDPKLGRDVALKVLPRRFTQDLERRSRLLQEARAAASLNHPNICTVYDVGEVDGQVYLTMEIIQGQSLSARLDERPLSPDEVLRYGLQLAEAVGHAHDHGVVHRDLKSANVMITAEGRAKVVDFGLARRLSSQELADVTTGAPVSLTQPGMILGTLAYMAPEQLRGEPADERSDVWALGVVLYEMATRKAPFAGQTGFELSAKIFHEAPSPLPPRMPVPLQTVVRRCLEKEPARRYRHGGEVHAALETVQSDVTSLQTESRAKWMRRPGFGVVASTFISGTRTGPSHGWRRGSTPASSIQECCSGARHSTN